MHLAASQRYQQTWPLSELPLVRPISDSSVYKRASAGRAPPNLKFHSDRRERGGPRRGERENCGASDLFESLVYSSLQAVGDRSFPPTYGLIFALILDDFVCGVPGAQGPLSVLTAYSSAGHGYITANLKKALWAA